MSFFICRLEMKSFFQAFLIFGIAIVLIGFPVGVDTFENDEGTHASVVLRHVVVQRSSCLGNGAQQQLKDLPHLFKSFVFDPTFESHDQGTISHVTFREGSSRLESFCLLRC